MTGIELTAGIITASKFIFMDILLVIIIIIVMQPILQYICNYFKIGYDDSDNKDTKTRSDLSVHTDHKTNLQYLSHPKGGLIPRLDKNGKHMRVYPKKH